MNAKDLTNALRGHETVTFEIRNLGSTTHDTKEFEEAVNEIESALSRSRIRDTATEPPTRKDGDNSGFVLAKCKSIDLWNMVYYYEVAVNPDMYIKWTQLPEVPDDKT